MVVQAVTKQQLITGGQCLLIYVTALLVFMFLLCFYLLFTCLPCNAIMGVHSSSSSRWVSVIGMLLTVPVCLQHGSYPVCPASPSAVDHPSSMQCACGGQAVGYCGSALSMQKSGGHDVLGCLMNCWLEGLCIHLKAVFVTCLSCKMLGR